jgi:hypothetical protein
LVTLWAPLRLPAERALGLPGKICQAAAYLSNVEPSRFGPARVAGSRRGARWQAYVCRLVAALGLFLRCTTPAHASGLEPETSFFGDIEPPDPYYVALRTALIPERQYRLCQNLTIPSFERERVVYFTLAEDGVATVVSRKLKHHLWPRLMREIERAAGSSSYSVGARAQEEALRHITIAVETRSATLDEKSAKLVARTCRDVLLAVRYPPPPPENVGYGRSDGVAHHAAHWITGHFLSGTTHSPEPATIAAQFVAMEEALAAYAEARAEQREAAKATLLKHARRLGKSVSALTAPKAGGSGADR